MSLVCCVENRLEMMLSLLFYSPIATVSLDKVISSDVIDRGEHYPPSLTSCAACASSHVNQLTVQKCAKNTQQISAYVCENCPNI